MDPDSSSFEPPLGSDLRIRSGRPARCGRPLRGVPDASRLALRRGYSAPFEVITIGISDRAVHAYGGLGLAPITGHADSDPVDILVVPGALAIDEVAACPALIQAILHLSGTAVITTSVWIDTSLLTETGLLEGKAWTTHWEDVAESAERTASPLGRTGVQWVDEGNLVALAPVSAWPSTWSIGFAVGSSHPRHPSSVDYPDPEEASQGPRPSRKSLTGRR